MSSFLVNVSVLNFSNIEEKYLDHIFGSYFFSLKILFNLQEHGVTVQLVFLFFVFRFSAQSFKFQTDFNISGFWKIICAWNYLCLSFLE